MTATVTVVPFSGYSVPGYALNIRLNVLIEPATGLTAEEIQRRGRSSSLAGCEILWDPATTATHPNPGRIPPAIYRLNFRISSRIASTDEVTANDTHVKLGNPNSIEDGISKCEPRRIGGIIMGVTTDQIILVSIGGVSGSATLEHELGHALGCRHTRTAESVMYYQGHGGNYTHRKLGVSDVLCIIHQLDLSHPGPQIISSAYVQDGRSTGIMSWEMGDPDPTPDRGMVNPRWRGS